MRPVEAIITHAIASSNTRKTEKTTALVANDAKKAGEAVTMEAMVGTVSLATNLCDSRAMARFIALTSPPLPWLSSNSSRASIGGLATASDLCEELGLLL